MTATRRRVALVTLGCARNEVDSSELAGRLAEVGWELVDDAAAAEVAVVNTCGFVEQAKKDSVDALLEAADLKSAGSRTQAVVAVGCLAERYGVELAESLPEADAVLGFDSYPDLARHLDAILAGDRPASHVPRDRRSLLPLSPAARPSASHLPTPGHGDPRDPYRSWQAESGAGVSDRLAPSQTAPSQTPPSQGAAGSAPDLAAGLAPATGPRVVRRLLDGRPWAPLKLASGCDRRCAFCAIPAFRGSFLSRPPQDVLAEARWLADQGISELLLVSENSTSYGKDLGDLRALEGLLGRLSGVDGIERIRVSYLQPAEIRPGLIEAIAETDRVAAYFDISFQHASAGVLRRMRRFGDRRSFADLVARVRAAAPQAGIRSNVIVGFPGETEADLAELHAFLEEALLDVVGVFGYSDEDGTEAATLDGHLPPEVIAQRVQATTDLVEALTDERAADRVGEQVTVLVEGAEDGRAVGRAEHQGPDVDGVTYLPGEVPTGRFVTAEVTGSDGVDLEAVPR
ncbi:MAG: 30S ribosomal protein S12 methylthiotransferase RimO [Actinomycetales bacterium]